MMMTDEEEETEVNGTEIQTRWERVRPPRRRFGRPPRSWRPGGGRSPGPPLEMRCPQGLQGAQNLLEDEYNVTCCLKFCLRTRAEDKHTKAAHPMSGADPWEAAGPHRPLGRDPRPCSALPSPGCRCCSPEVANEG